MTENRHIETDTLIFRFLEPLQRCFNEAMYTMGRGVDQDRVATNRQELRANKEDRFQHKAGTMPSDPSVILHTHLSEGEPDLSQTILAPGPKGKAMAVNRITAAQLADHPKDGNTSGPVSTIATKSGKDTPLTKQSPPPTLNGPLLYSPPLNGNHPGVTSMPRENKPPAPMKQADQRPTGRGATRSKTEKRMAGTIKSPTRPYAIDDARGATGTCAENIGPAAYPEQCMKEKGAKGPWSKQVTSPSHLSRRIPLTPQVRGTADRVAASIEPLLAQARGVSPHAFQTTTESTTTIASGPDFRSETESHTIGRVSNTFNVNVSMSADDGLKADDRQTLEDALVDILRTAARRHGLDL